MNEKQTFTSRRALANLVKFEAHFTAHGRQTSPQIIEAIGLGKSATNRYLIRMWIAGTIRRVRCHRANKSGFISALWELGCDENRPPPPVVKPAPARPYRNEWRRTFTEPKSLAAIAKISEYMAESGMVTVQEITDATEINITTVRETLNHMKSTGDVHMLKSRYRNGVYVGAGLWSIGASDADPVDTGPGFERRYKPIKAVNTGLVKRDWAALWIFGATGMAAA